MREEDFRRELMRRLPDCYNGSRTVVLEGEHRGYKWYIVAGHMCPLAYIAVREDEYPMVYNEETYRETSHELLPKLEEGWVYSGYDYHHSNDFFMYMSGNINPGMIWDEGKIAYQLRKGIDEMLDGRE